MTLILVVLGLTVPVFALQILLETGRGKWLIYKAVSCFRGILTFPQSERIARWLDEN